MPEDNKSQDENTSQSHTSTSSDSIVQQSNNNMSEQPSTERTGIINGQSFTPSAVNQLEQTPSYSKSSKWRYFFIFIGVLQAAGIGLFLLTMLWAAILAKGGTSGTEFIALILYITVVPAVGIISLINLVGLPIYIRKYKPQGKRKIFAIISLVISALLVLYGVYNVVYGLYIYPNKLNERGKQASEQREKKIVTANTKPEITKEEAISFLQNCKADYFVGYTDINLIKDANTKSWLNNAEQSSSGVEISDDSPKSYVFASRAMTTELQDTARQIRQSCYSKRKLYITIDNYIETEYPAGKWTRVKQ